MAVSVAVPDCVVSALGVEEVAPTPESEAALGTVVEAFAADSFSPLSAAAVSLAGLPGLVAFPLGSSAFVEALGIAFGGGAPDVSASFPEVEGQLAGFGPGLVAVSNKVDLSSSGFSLKTMVPFHVRPDPPREIGVRLLALRSKTPHWQLDVSIDLLATHVLPCHERPLPGE